MNLQQVGQLLTLASLIDNRDVTPEVAMAWEATVGDLDYDAAVAAMYTHFREEPSEYLMPAHIVKGVRAAQRKELPETMSPEAAEVCSDGKHRWLADGTCMLCLARKEQGAIRARSGGAPKPANLKAMEQAAAEQDPVKWAAELARYNQQLAEAGYPPVSWPLRF
jgi:hypothetical protein